MEIPIKIEGKSLIQLSMWGCILGLLISFGIFYYITKFIIENKQPQYFWILLIIPIGIAIFFIFMMRLISKSWAKWEAYEYKLKEEKCISEVIDQDFKLLQMKIMENEHNMKVRDFNKKLNNNKEKIGEIRWRDVENMAKQALNLKFYNKVYNRDILEKKDKRKF